jgi:hypothetical protein
MNIFWRFIIINRYGTFCTCADSFKIFCCLFDKKKSSLFCSFWNYYLWKSFQKSNPLQRLLSGDFDIENAYRKPPVILYNHTGSRQWQVNRRKHRPIIGYSEEGFSKHFKISTVSNFKEANKKLINVYIVYSVADLRYLSRILIFTHAGSRIPDLGSRIQKQEQKRRLKKFVVILFLKPQISQNCKLFYFWNAEEKKFGPIFKEL